MSTVVTKSAAAKTVEKGSVARILDAAELLFAQHGYKACTFRQISDVGDVNQGLLHYHFGTKEELFRRVFLRRANELSATRISRLTRLQAKSPDGAVPLTMIVKAYLEPVLEMYESGPGPRAFLRIHAQLKADPLEFSLDLRRQAFGEATTLFLRALERACPHLSPVAVRWRMHTMIGAYQMVVSQGGRIQDFLDEIGSEIDIHDALYHTVAFSVAGFEAPDLRRSSRALRGVDTDDGPRAPRSRPGR